MTGHRLCAVAVAAAAWLAACAGAPSGPGPAAAGPAPEPAAPPPVRTTTPAPAVKAPPQVVRLANGMTAVVTTVPPGRPATLQFGVSAGAAVMAPGAAELAAQLLVDSADPNEGRVALRQAIARMGGTLQVQVGPLTTWLDLRVPGDRWRDALRALRDALQAPTWSRHQIERIREQFVAARVGALRSDPALALAQLLLLGDSSGAGYVLGLLDRDPGEITLFLARAWRPETTVLAMEVPAEANAAAAELGQGGTVALATWAPAAPPPGALTLLDRKFESGLWWAPSRIATEPTAPCRVALVAMLPGLGQLAAADELLLLACLSLEGTGGRLERLQRERGLEHVRWLGGLVTTPDAAAFVLTTEVPANEVGALWRTVELARNSLRDVPPNDSELALARARVPLTARLLLADDGARVRTTTMLALAGGSIAAVERRLEMLATRPASDFGNAAAALLDRPFAMVVVGGEVAADVPGVRRIELLPASHDAQPPAPAAASAARPQPWLADASDALGGADLLRRLTGWHSEANVVHEQAPPLQETVRWSLPDSLQRTRTVLGQQIETRLQGSEWSERMGDTVRSLDARQAAVLRRELQRHPLALLAAHARGDLTFRTIAQRDAGDRTVVVLEAAGTQFDRLRIHVDTQSHLVRVVETWETLADGTVVHLADAWQDYRTVAGLRVPMRRLTTLDDGHNRVETVFTKWSPVLGRD